MICASARRALVRFRSFLRRFSVSTSLWLTWKAEHNGRHVCYSASHSTYIKSETGKTGRKYKTRTVHFLHLYIKRKKGRSKCSYVPSYTWSWAVSSLASSSLLSLRTFCLSSYSSSNWTSICFSYRRTATSADTQTHGRNQARTIRMHSYYTNAHSVVKSHKRESYKAVLDMNFNPMFPPGNFLKMAPTTGWCQK